MPTLPKGIETMVARSQEYDGSRARCSLMSGGARALAASALFALVAACTGRSSDVGSLPKTQSNAEPQSAAAEAPKLMPQNSTPASDSVAVAVNGAKDCDTCPEMVTIPAGSFDMGSHGSEAGHSTSEGPIHRVNVASFALGKFEVTRGQFTVFVNETGYDAGTECNTLEGGKFEFGKRSGHNWRDPGFGQDDSHPVVCVSWNDALAYAQFLSRKTGRRYRPPSEAEWEYAARAGTATARYWGSNPDEACSYANIMDSTAASRITGAKGKEHGCVDGYPYTAPVGSFKPNRFGLYDMIGNVSELTEDCMHGNYIGAPVDGSAWTSDECAMRAVRGGSWAAVSQHGLGVSWFTRSASRLGTEPGTRSSVNGFRIARDN